MAYKARKVYTDYHIYVAFCHTYGVRKASHSCAVTGKGRSSSSKKIAAVSPENGTLMMRYLLS
jgi:hypothetical protein